MADFARSSDPAVQRQLHRLAALTSGGDVLGLERITALLTRLGDPHRRLPPVFHVAGTNGKGSTCAFLRAALEAAGHEVHVYTSPHLVRFNERIRVAGTLIDDAALAGLLAEVLDVSDEIGPSFFEVTTAAAFLAFARTPAAACVIEVGLGGRLDATNVVVPVVTGIAGLGIDHQFFLGDTLGEIAGEKAGIAKPGVSLVTQHYVPEAAEAVGAGAAAACARWLARGSGWHVHVRGRQLRYRDGRGELDLPLPRLPGAHQEMNAGLAVAMIRHQDAVAVPGSALNAAMDRAVWPARLQKLKRGPLIDGLPAGSDVWLDGGHNPAAAQIVAEFAAEAVAIDRPLHIVLGLLANKDADGVVGHLAGRDTTIHAVPVPGHESHAPEALVRIAAARGLRAVVAEDVASALGTIADDVKRRAPAVLIMGSLYLAGEVLRENGQTPD